MTHMVNRTCIKWCGGWDSHPNLPVKYDFTLKKEKS
jgi:hypothetical protein